MQNNGCCKALLSNWAPPPPFSPPPSLPPSPWIMHGALLSWPVHVPRHLFAYYFRDSSTLTFLVEHGPSPPVVSVLWLMTDISCSISRLVEPSCAASLLVKYVYLVWVWVWLTQKLRATRMWKSDTNGHSLSLRSYNVCCHRLTHILTARRGPKNCQTLNFATNLSKIISHCGTEQCLTIEVAQVSMVFFFFFFFLPVYILQGWPDS